ncbi:MAG: ABC transporter ATP-binding protein/permease [Chloroflexota bacterium]
MSANTGFLRRVWALIVPYWRSEERLWAWVLLGAVVALTLGRVYLLVLLNTWNRDFYNALEQRDYDAFLYLLLYFCGLAAVFIVLSVYRLYLSQMLEIRWRVWLTTQYLGSWLKQRVYYLLELRGRSTDNPDQRIAEDLRKLSGGTLGLALGLLSSVVTLVSFITVLWEVSGPLEFELGGTAVFIPGYMVWVAIVYAIVGSVLTHYVGRPLIPLSFQQERLEADFRFNLVRVRENAEGVALYKGEEPERAGLIHRMDAVRLNWYELMRYTKRLTSFTVGYDQVADIFPILVAAPRYFAGAINLGQLFQITNAFGRVQGALSWFVTTYGSLADWKASMDRLLTFQDALNEIEREAASPATLTVLHGGDGALSVAVERLKLPNGRVVLNDVAFQVSSGDRLLISGPSGSGKTSLFRAIAGIWPYGEGAVTVPSGARLLFLPQKPYIPIGTLRAAVSYPEREGAYAADQVSEALSSVGLGHLVARLDAQENWSLALSGGEQQRLAMARALLHRPDFLFMDEATSALDEDSERHLLSALRDRLPKAAVISISHRSGDLDFATRRLTYASEQDRPTLRETDLVGRGH